MLATHDIILTALGYMRQPGIEVKSLGVSFAEDSIDSVHSSVSTSLSDDVLYGCIMPSFESVFAGRSFQRLGKYSFPPLH